MFLNIQKLTAIFSTCRECDRVIPAEENYCYIHDTTGNIRYGIPGCGLHQERPKEELFKLVITDVENQEEEN